MSEFTKIKYLQFNYPKKIVVVKSGYDEKNYKIKKSISKKKVIWYSLAIANPEKVYIY